ncbi:hypothetical protein [Mycobacteroides abscessus]|uniref:hypothetical protein n=1 Tax=Mycobacteroides abscessus TaxID=36809 RepID=UPI000C266B60|nr:hypothetical protein [Mycobacteroides abscessus]
MENRFWGALERAKSSLAQDPQKALTAGRYAYGVATSYYQRNAAVRVIKDTHEPIDTQGK